MAIPVPIRPASYVRMSILDKEPIAEPTVKGPFDLLPYMRHRIKLVCGLCTFNVGTVVVEAGQHHDRMVDGATVLAEVWTVAVVDGGGDAGRPSKNVRSQRGDPARIDRKEPWFADIRERYSCPNRKCQFHRHPRRVLQGNLVRAFYEAARAGRSDIVLGSDV